MPLIDVVAQEAGEPGAALPHLAEIIVGFVAFSVLVYIVGRYAWPLFTKSHEDHNRTISSGMKRAETEQQQAQDELARQRARLAEVDNDAARIRDDARADAERIKEDMAERAREEADRVVAQGRQSVEASRSRTVSDLRAEVGRGSVELARRIVSASLADDSRRGRSVDSFLDQLESMADGTGDGSGSNGSNGSGSTPRTPHGSTAAAGSGGAADGADR